MIRVVRWFAAQPVSRVALHSIKCGTLPSAAEYDGWISCGHKASVLMVVPIAAWAVCAWLADLKSSRDEATPTCATLE